MKILPLIAVVLFLSLYFVSCPDDNDNVENVYLSSKGVSGSYKDDGSYVAGKGSGDLFEIISPYQNVNWDAVDQFKSANHVHTINSDGSATMSQLLQLYYDLDYDIITVTDHVHAENHGRRAPLEDTEDMPHRPYVNLINRDVTNDKWQHGEQTADKKTYVSNLSHITQDQKTKYENGTADSATRSVNRGMQMIKGTAELAPEGDEVNVFFYPQNRLPPKAWDNVLRGALADMHDAGAIGFINHPGRTTGAMKDENKLLEPTDPENPSNQGVWIRYYANRYIEFPITTLTGMEIFNRRDDDSFHDRVLWDNVNKLTIPQGRFVWGYGNDDFHSTNVSATGNGAHINYNVMLMPSNTPENFRKAMVNGHSYIVTVVAFNEGVDITSLTPWKQRPAITSIIFEDDLIIINAVNANKVVWISDGRTIKTETGTTGFYFINLADPAIIDDVGSFVRANIIGPDGMAVIQPISTKRK
jgi:hypothetical protein